MVRAGCQHNEIDPVSLFTNRKISPFQKVSSSSPSSVPVDETGNLKTQLYSSYSLKVPSSWFVWRGNTEDFAQLSNFDPDNENNSGDYDPAKDRGFLKLEIYKEQFSGTLGNFVSKDHKNSEELQGVTTWYDSPSRIGGQSAIRSKSGLRSGKGAKKCW